MPPKKAAATKASAASTAASERPRRGTASAPAPVATKKTPIKKAAAKKAETKPGEYLTSTCARQSDKKILTSNSCFRPRH